ncbi:MAG: cytochrome c4 [Xanthomonadales bacterium]|nr:cytochrome c4 [Xanthomonadales bacterium]
MKWCFVASTLMLLASCSREANQPPEPAADIGAGKAIADTECIDCHGADGHGVAPGIPQLSAQPADYLLASLQAYQSGERTHAALRDLTNHMNDADMVNVSAYYASLSPPEQPATIHDKMTSYEEGEQIAKACVSCHGESGNSVIAGIPSLAGQQPLYFIAATQAYLTGIRDIETMEKSLRGLSRTDIEKLALYYASQVPDAHQAPENGDPEAGMVLSAQCGGCHGGGGVSHDAATPSLAGQDPLYLANAAKAYRGHVRHHDVMFADKSDEDIANIAAYYAIQQPRAAEDEPISAAKLSRSCDRCHGPGIDSPNLATPRLNGQDRDYLIMALRAYRDDKRHSTTMHKMSLPYSDTMIESLATLYSSREAR